MSVSLSAQFALAQPKGQGRKGKKPAAPPATQTAPQAAAPSATAAAPDSAAALESQKEEARTHFERGIALSDEEAWEAAFVEFSRSRALFPTKGNTKNVALALRKLHRFDEALDAYEALQQEFPQLTAQDKAFIAKELDELNKRVGLLTVNAEAGALVNVGGKARGAAPLAKPLRLSVGSHVVRVFKDGYVPFEARVDIVSGQAAQVDATLEPLTQSGKLRISEQSGKQVDVEIDHAVVGQTPWEGTLPPGEHTVVLRGEGNLGTQPASVPVQLNETAQITLAVEPLESELRIEPSPAGATVAIDGVDVGRGLWVGRLRTGKHTVEVGAEGFLPERREFSLEAGANERLSMRLERDPNSPLWRRIEPSRFVIQAAVLGAAGSSIGGDVSSDCASGCAKGVPFGFGAQIRAGYELGSGIGFGVDAGYLGLRQHVKDRAGALTPMGLPPNPGTLDDNLAFNGLSLGGAAWIRRGKPWGWEARLGAGVVLGSMRDERSGDFQTVTSKLPDGSALNYHVGVVSESSAAHYLYAAPEVRAVYRFTSSAEVGFGLSALVLVSLTQPSWQDKQPLITGSCGPVAAGCVTDGQARFGSRPTASQFIVMGAPVVSLRMHF